MRKWRTQIAAWHQAQVSNGPTETMIIGVYKTECIRTTVFHPGPYRTIADVEYATAG